MLKVKYTDGTVEEFEKANNWSADEVFTELVKEVDGEEEGEGTTIAIVFNRNVFSIQ